MRRFLLGCALSTLSVSALATDAQIKSALAPFGVTDMQITDSPLAGIKTIVTNQGIFYASPDGKYFLQGSLVEITPNGPRDISYQPLMKKLNALQDKMIIYPAAQQKYVVTVFTDITCPYCHLLHKALPEYNKLGITIRYMAFPRAGATSKVGEEMEAIWQSDDPKAGFAAALQGVVPAGKPVDIVQQEYDLGLAFGVNGTPAMVTESGQVIPGFIKPQQLLEILQQSAGK